MSTPRVYTAAFGGQSNTQGAGDAALSPQVSPNGWMWQATANAASGVWAVGNDPQQPNKPASMKSQTGSKVPAFLNAMLEDARVSEVRATMFAMSGTHMLRRVGETPSNDWGIGGQLRLGLFKQIDLMLASPQCTGTLDVFVWGQGESDGYRLGLYPSQLAAFPHGYVVQEAAHPMTGEIVSYLDGYQNPGNLPDLYTARKEFYEAVFAKYPGVKIISDLTATWKASTGSLTHQRGCRQVQWIDLAVIKDLKAAGFNIVANTTPLQFDSLGLIKADGVHMGQPALNILGASDAALALDGEIVVIENFTRTYNNLTGAQAQQLDDLYASF